MKNLLTVLIASMISVSGFADELKRHDMDEAIEITKILSADEGQTDIKTLPDFKRVSELYYYNYGQVVMEFEFKVIGGKNKLNNAKDIAHYVYRFLSNGVTTRIPYPCGFYYVGETNEIAHDKFSHSIYASGDGGVDSCTDSGGPGWWDQHLEIELKDSFTGKVKAYFVSE